MSVSLVWHTSLNIQQNAKMRCEHARLCLNMLIAIGLETTAEQLSARDPQHLKFVIRALKDPGNNKV